MPNPTLFGAEQTFSPRQIKELITHDVVVEAIVDRRRSRVSKVFLDAERDSIRRDLKAGAKALVASLEVSGEGGS